MLGARTLQYLSLLLQDITDVRQPFGGISILAVGDLLQLNPVGDSPVFSPPKPGYAALYGSLFQKNFVLHELDMIVHQQGDPEFAQMLSRIRVGDITVDDTEKLQALSTPTEPLPQHTTHLFIKNNNAAAHNAKMINTLDPPVITIHAKTSKSDAVTGKVPIVVQSQTIHETGNLPDTLVIAKKARFLLTKNIDIQDMLVNGATGIIEDFNINPNAPLEGTIYVQFDNPLAGQQARRNLPPHLKNFVPIKATTTKFQRSRTARVEVERTQYPGVLDWGLTVHKAQGSTYTHMVGDLTTDTKTPAPQGLVYTLLSRVTTMSRLKLINFHPSKVKVNTTALEEMQRLRRESCFTWKHPILTSSDEKICAHLNVRSMSAHYNHLKSLNYLASCNILGVTETHLSNPYHTRGRMNRNTGGMKILCPFLDIPTAFKNFQLHSNYIPTILAHSCGRLECFAHAQNFPTAFQEEMYSNCIPTSLQLRFKHSYDIPTTFETFQSHSWALQHKNLPNCT